MKRVWSWLLTIMLVFGVLTGCMGNDEGIESDSHDEKVKLKFWHAWQGEEADKLQVYVDKYMEKHPEVIIETLSGTNTEKQMLALSGGDSFDIGYNMDYRMPLWGREGMLLSLNELIKETNYDKEDILQAELKLLTLKDQVYGIPFTCDTYLLYYNKDILQEIGADVPETWEELYEVALQTVKKDENGDYSRLGFLNNFPWKNELVFPLMNGADYVDISNNKILFTSPENMEAIKFKASFHGGPDYDTEKIIKFQSGFGQYASAENAFLKGQLAFSVDGEWFPTFIKMYNPSLNYGIAPIPYNADKPEFKDRGSVAAGALYIPKDCDHPKEAFDFIRYLTEQAQVPFCIDKGSLPATKSGLKDPTLVEKAPTLKPFVDLALAGKLEAMPQVPYLTELMKAIGDAEDSIYDGTATVEEACQKAKDEAQKVADKVMK